MACRDTTGPVNIGNPKEMTVLQLAQTVIELTQSAVSVVYEDLPVDDPKVRQPDIALAGELLGWEPKIDIREGLPLTIEYFKRIRQSRQEEA
jgi:nucleoside-diphosphate-sugar epimerase